MHRLFVALRPARTQREALLGMMGGVTGVRWQDDSQLHVTLRFIGEVDRRVGEDIAVALAGVRHPRFALGLAGVGTFDRRGRIDAVWAGITPHEEIAALHRKIDQALIRAGLAPEGRAYLPHVTIARLGGGAGPVGGFVAAHPGFAAPAEMVTMFHLYESRLGRDGAAYEIVESYPLAG